MLTVVYHLIINAIAILQTVRQLGGCGLQGLALIRHIDEIGNLSLNAVPKHTITRA